MSNPNDDPQTKPGIVEVEYLDAGNTALLHIRQFNGDVLKFTVPTMPLVEFVDPSAAPQPLEELAPQA
jgi:hypothetical protein